MTNRVLISVKLFLCIALFSPAFAETSKEDDSISVPRGFNFETKNGKSNLRVNLFAQGMLLYRFQDSSTKTFAFNVPAARVILSGQAVKPEATYFGSFDFAGFEGSGSPELVDLYFGYRFCDCLGITLGRFKVPFSRIFLTEDPDRSFAMIHTNNNRFSLNRDIGLNVHGRFLDNRLEYNLFGFNGSDGSFSQSNNDTNVEMIFGARFDFHMWGKTAFEEMNWDRATEISLGMALAYDHSTSNGQAASVPRNRLTRLTADAAFQFGGFTGILAGHYIHNATNKASTRGIESNLTYFVIPSKLLFAAKAMGHMPSKSGALGEGAENHLEIGGAINYFLFNRNLKVVADYTAELRRQTSSGVNLTDHRMRLQLQVWL